jgi:excisionase family DNA binding protein
VNVPEQSPSSAESTGAGAAHVPRLSLNVREAAAALGLREGTVRDLILRHELPVVRVGGGTVKARWVLRVEDLAKWLERNRRPARWEGER